MISAVPPAPATRKMPVVVDVALLERYIVTVGVNYPTAERLPLQLNLSEILWSMSEVTLGSFRLLPAGLSENMKRNASKV